RAWAALALVLFGVLAVSGEAGAAKPFDVGMGRNAEVAIDGAGTAHVTWLEEVTGQSADIAHYCQLARGATSCRDAHQFTYPSGSSQGLDSGVWPLLPGGGRVLVVDSRCCAAYAQKFVYSSSDGGGSFDAGA